MPDNVAHRLDQHVEAPVMEARLITRMDEQYWATDDLFETVVPPLIHTRRPPRFDF